jgi:hypothetical protein
MLCNPPVEIFYGDKQLIEVTNCGDRTRSDHGVDLLDGTSKVARRILDKNYVKYFKGPLLRVFSDSGCNTHRKIVEEHFKIRHHTTVSCPIRSKFRRVGVGNREKAQLPSSGVVSIGIVR